MRMSLRRSQLSENVETTRLRAELETLKQQSVIEASVEPASTQFDQLSGTEKAAGSLGVHPTAWKPIR